MFASLSSLKIPVELFDQQNWVDSPVSDALGFPLKVARWPAANSRLANKFAQGLFMWPNPEAVEFGCVRFRRVDGAVLVARRDGRDVEQREVEALLIYLSTVAKEVTDRVREEREKRRQKEKELAALMAPPVPEEGKEQGKQEVPNAQDQLSQPPWDEQEEEEEVVKEVEKEVQKLSVGFGQMDGTDERDEEDAAEWASKKVELAKRLLSEKAFREFAKSHAMKAA